MEKRKIKNLYDNLNFFLYYHILIIINIIIELISLFLFLKPFLTKTKKFYFIELQKKIQFCEINISISRL